MTSGWGSACLGGGWQFHISAPHDQSEVLLQPEDRLGSGQVVLSD